MCTMSRPTFVLLSTMNGRSDVAWKRITLGLDKFHQETQSPLAQSWLPPGIRISQSIHSQEEGITVGHLRRSCQRSHFRGFRTGEWLDVVHYSLSKKPDILVRELTPDSPNSDG